MNSRIHRFAWVAVLAIAGGGCTKVVEFDRRLELPDFRDASTEVVFACETEQDCSALGECVVCEFNVCIEASEADQDGDGHYNALCRGVNKGDDCDDLESEVHPEAEEKCNGLDDNCNGIVDEGDAFGLTWTTSQASARSPAVSPVAGRTGIGWVEGSTPCPTVLSAFLDDGGVIRYPAILSSCGEDVFMAPRGASAGFSAVYVDRTGGGADIHFRLLDTLGQPVPFQPDAVNISADFEESDMPVVGWADRAYHFGAAWLSHDTDDRDLMQVLFVTLDTSGEPILADPVVLSTAPFTVTSGSDSGFGEKLSLIRVDDDAFEGFAASWVEDSGIWFAIIVTSEDGTVIEQMVTRSISDDVDTAGAILPSLTWAGDRFVIAYAWDDPSTVKASPDVELVQVTGHDTGTLMASPMDLPFEFPREATYPALVYHPDIVELGLAWADGREGYGTRHVRFARLKIVDTPEGPSAVPVLEDIVLTDLDAYAGAIAMGVEPGAGFVVSWTHRQGTELGLEVGYLECKQ